MDRREEPKRPPEKRRARRRTIFILAGLSLLFLGISSLIHPPGFTRIELRDDAGERRLLSVILRDGEPVVLTWNNSLFGIPVREVFLPADGVLIQREITFSRPDGRCPPRVSPEDAADLYHTGGAFAAEGLARPFQRIVYRIGEIGDPILAVREHAVELKKEAGFGGRVILTATSPDLWDVLKERSGMGGTR